jgi:hypothetical protein
MEYTLHTTAQSAVFTLSYAIAVSLTPACIDTDRVSQNRSDCCQLPLNSCGILLYIILLKFSVSLYWFML